MKTETAFSTLLAILLAISSANTSSCSPINLGEQAKLIGSKFKVAAFKKYGSDLNFFPVFRETKNPKNHLSILETNPHFRSGVQVCKGHNVTVYVGVYPYFKLQDFSRKLVEENFAVPNPVKPSEGLSFDPIAHFFVCAIGQNLQKNGLVVDQFPKPGTLMRTYFRESKPTADLGVNAPKSEVLLFLDCQTRSAVPPVPPVPPPTEGNTEYSAAQVSTAAAGGATLAYFLSGGGAQRRVKLSLVPLVVRRRDSLKVRVRAVPDIPT